MNLIDFSIYDVDTGRILRSGQSQVSTLGQQPMADGEAMIFGALDPDLHFVDRGRAAVRPALPDVQVVGSGFSFAAMPPAGTVAVIRGDYIEGEVAITAQAVALAVPEAAEVEISGPWPFRTVTLHLPTDAYSGPPDAQVVPPDLDRMRAYFTRAVAARGDELADAMLGDPDDHRRSRWKLKRSIRDRYLAGSNTAADEAAMAEAVRYSGRTVQQELDAIGAKIGFEDWVTLRADGIRQETKRRLNAATTPTEMLDVISWAEAESAAAVSEAQAKLAA